MPSRWIFAFAAAALAASLWAALDPTRGGIAVLLAAFAVLAAGFAWLEGGTSSARDLTLVATLGGLAAAGRVLFAPIPDVQPVTVMVAAAGVALGPRRGFAVGALAALASNFFLGLITDGRGRPVAVSVFDGNVADPTTLLPQVQRLRERFGIQHVVLVGDRGMISQKSIDELQRMEGMVWITALKSPQIQKLLTSGALQLGLFDERNLFELTDPAFPGERLMACRNAALATRRAHTRQALLAATTRDLEKIQARVARGRLHGRAEIGLRVGRVINHYKVAKHFAVTITETDLHWTLRTTRIETEAALDGLYLIRTNASAATLSAADAVRHYKALSHVERAFRSLKTLDLHVRPIHHRLADRVRSHIFLCMLAYYVEWHLREAWRPLLFADEDQQAKATRDPVAPATRSAAADQKAATHQLADGTPVHSFRTLLQDLSAIVRNECRTPGHGDDAPTFTVTTTPTPEQRRAFELLNGIAV